MKRPTWQFHLLLFAILSLLSTADASDLADGSIEKRTESTPTPTHTLKKHKFSNHHNHTKIHTVTVNNCTASAIQSKLLHQTKKINGTKTITTLPTPPGFNDSNHTSTVYVCHKTKHVSGKNHHSTKKHHSSKHHTTTVSKKHHTSTKKHHTSTKKHHTSVKKHHSSKKKDEHHVSEKKHSTKKHTTTHSKKHTTTHSKKHTTTKKTHKKTKKTTTKAQKKQHTTTVAATDTVEVVPASLPTARVNSSGDDSNIDDTYEEPVNNTPEPTISDTPTAAAAAAAVVSTPSPSTADTNNQVTAQSVNQEKSVDAEPQSKVVGVSVGAVVGCIAAAGLAGMFIYKRKQKTAQEQDIEYNDSNVNTRWKTQSFMAVVAGAVAKLPKRSNSSASQSSQRSVGVFGSIRRAVSNASSFRSNRSSHQSYGMATSDPLPPLARIDGDQARYYAEPAGPNEHTHAY